MVTGNSTPYNERDIPQVFISYRHTEEDLAFARQLRDRIRSIGYRVWMDERSLVPGDTWDDRIDEGLRNSDLVIGVMTPDSVASRNVRNEWVFATERGIRLILLLLKPTEIPHNFIRVSYLDFTAQDKSAAFGVLEETVSALFRAPEGVPMPSAPETEELPARELIPLQRFQPSASPHWIGFASAADQLWVSDGEQIEAFVRGTSYPAARWLLPNVRWKHIMPQTWQDRMLCSDWDGSLRVFGGPGHDQGEIIYRARYDDLPIHLLATGSAGQLFAATWDGGILAWDREGRPLLPRGKASVPYLPRSITACGEGLVAVADSAGALWVFEVNGELLWRWQANGEIQAIWSHQDGRSGGDGRPILILLLDGDRIARIRVGQTEAQTLALPAGVRLLSHLKRGSGDGWTVLALEDRTIGWLSWSSFRIPSAYQIKTDWDVQEIIALHDSQRPSALVALGLSSSGQLFALSDRRMRLYPESSARKVCPDPSGRFLYCVVPDGIHMYRNPAILPVSCQVSVESVGGTLAVGEYRELSLGLINSGSVPISKLKAKVRGRDRIVPSSELSQEGHFLPGDRIPLRFSVQAIAAGMLQLDLLVSMEDEAGPPEIHRQLEVHVESTRS